LSFFCTLGAICDSLVIIGPFLAAHAPPAMAKTNAITAMKPGMPIRFLAKTPTRSLKKVMLEGPLPGRWFPGNPKPEPGGDIGKLEVVQGNDGGSREKWSSAKD
jgi:hypothetical protein